MARINITTAMNTVINEYSNNGFDENYFEMTQLPVVCDICGGSGEDWYYQPKFINPNKGYFDKCFNCSGTGTYIPGQGFDLLEIDPWLTRRQLISY